MARIVYGGQLFPHPVNLCLQSKDLMNFEPPYRKCWLLPWIQCDILPPLLNLYSLVYQDTRSCLSGQESCVAHKCVIYIKTHGLCGTQVCYLQESLTCHFQPSYLYTHWADFYQIHIFYAHHIHDPTYQISKKTAQ